MKRIITLAIIIAAMIQASAQESRLMRFPAIWGDNIVFTYAGNLYIVNSSGGIARKLTSHEGFEMFARFSPDGKWIAFTGQYDGNTEVYLIPSQGGEPKRLTYTATIGRDDISDRMGPNNIVMSWTPDGKYIVYRSRKNSWNDFTGRLYKVPADGGMSEELPLPAGGFHSFSEDGSKLAFNRVMREFRTWKYYRGGMADDVWIYDFKTKKTVNLTENKAQDIFPMWQKNEIYFCSDRDRIMNLFSYNTETKAIKKVTDFTGYDIKFPSADNGKIVFENGGFIYVFDVVSQKAEKVPVLIKDDVSSGRSCMKNAAKFINGSSVSHDGNRIVFSARGDVWTVPVKEGVTRNLSRSSGVHERNAVWSPDGRHIAYLSDVSGEYEIYMVKSDGSENPVQLTSNGDTYIFSIEWSPDSKKILFNDKKFRLRYVDTETKSVTTVVQSKTWEIGSFSWSPDSKWIAWSDRLLNNTMSQVFIYSLQSKKSEAVTDEWYSSSSPVFSLDGKFLFLVSSRDFNPVYSNTEWNHSYTDMSKLYLVSLQKDVLNPFSEKNQDTLPEQGSDKKKEEKITVPDVIIDFQGIKERIAVFPVKAGNYRNISQSGDKVFYTYTSKSEHGNSVRFYNLKEKKEITVGTFRYYEITANRKKILLCKDNDYYVTEIPSAEVKAENPVKLKSMEVYVDNRKEWNQIFDESWRQMRDFFYDPGMHGVDWKKIREKYSVLLPYVNDRNDLNYVIGEMIGELSVGHAYTGGGDRPSPEKIYTGMLGAGLSKDKSGYFRIDKILEGQNWNEKLVSPLTDIGLNVKQGDYIIEVNGISVKEYADIYLLLWNTAGKLTELAISSSPDGKSVRKIYVTPLKDDINLQYLNWVQNNIRMVDKATNGQVGYIHIPDMGVDGLNEFAKYFYPQLNKKGLIIDDRGNGGGNVSQMIIERLRREIVFMKMARNTVEGSTAPQSMHYGPKVLLMNNYSASDGDLFPYQFRKMGLGKIIGVRSWGGVVGIRGSLPFVDGGFLNRPEFASYAEDGSGWIIEGYGVDPDIVIDNDPAKEYAGEDEQLLKAIEVVLEEIKNNPKEKEKIPDFPDKSK